MSQTPSQTDQSGTENRLARETSPYLLQHKDNPVAWWPWGTDALAEAKRTGKPILLSVGYAACHWCHVMAHESFENEATAAVMNELFVNIKVDREERPDIDQIYMSALHHLGRAGRLAADDVPDAGRRAGVGRHVFSADVALRQAGVHRRAARGRAAVPRGARQDRAEPRRADGAARRAGASARQGHDRRRRSSTRSRGRSAARSIRCTAACAARRSFPTRSFTNCCGGRGCAAATARFFDAVTHTLERICEGGIYDHLGGGFSRYSVDEKWLVPHFEKMLYDNAQLLELLPLACFHTGNAAVPRAGARDGDLARAGDDDLGGRVLRLARRRLGRRGGQVLRLVDA